MKFNTTLISDVQGPALSGKNNQLYTLKDGEIADWMEVAKRQLQRWSPAVVMKLSLRGIEALRVRLLGKATTQVVVLTKTGGCDSGFKIWYIYKWLRDISPEWVQSIASEALRCHKAMKEEQSGSEQATGAGNMT